MRPLLRLGVGLVFCAGAVAAPGPAADSPAGKKEGVRLPRVLIIGDSISIGYTPPLTEMLKGEAAVTHHKGNAQFTGTGLRMLDQWVGDTKWDVIHFNWGLWDLCYRHPDSKVQGHRDKVKGTLTTTLDQYEENLEQLVTRLQRTGATLIWASTTLVPDGEAGRIVGDDRKYNEAAARVMGKHGIPIDDLYGLTKGFSPALFQEPGDVHYTKEGYRRIAGQVAGEIRKALKGRLPAGAARTKPGGDPPREKVRVASAAVPAAPRPNVLFIALDDLNDWIGCLGGNPQARTPNIDRLARESVVFTNAHCAAPSCNPSRTAVFSGLAPWNSGLLHNGQKLREVIPDAELLPRYFSRHGYWSAGSGKMLHYIIDPPSWDAYFPHKAGDDPFPPHMDFGKRPKSLPRAGKWQYVETDWGAFDATDEQFGGDFLVTKWIGEQLAVKHDQPFFLACGIYRPHEPWFVPGKYFDLFPLADIQLPPGYRADDLDDVPPAGQRLGRNRYFAHIREQHQWRQGLQGYLASIAYADAMLGRVLDALDHSPDRDNTIVVLWSDHGWHLGEKEHWQKYTGWRVCTRIPLIIRVPKMAPGLTAGTTAGGVCARPVSLLSLYPTLTELCGLPAKPENDGPSLVPLLKDPQAAWPHAAVTQLDHPGTYSVSADNWRYIHYPDGGEELYDIQRDRYEWTNLAKAPGQTGRLAAMRKLGPVLSPRAQAAGERFTATRAAAQTARLEWQPLAGEAPPVSNPSGAPFPVSFVNQRTRNVKLCWISPQHERKLYGEILPEASQSQSTRQGAVWLVTDADGKDLGYFVVGKTGARAVIPDV